MKRETLLQHLKSIAPALGSKDIVEYIPCACFDDKILFAFDDTVALVTNYKEGFGIVGGVQGQLLIDWLSASGAKDIIVGSDPKAPNTVLFKAGRAKLKLPLLPKKDEKGGFIFEIPKLKKPKSFKVTDEFLGGLKRVALSMGNDPGHQWRMGVTVHVTKNRVTFYAADNLTIARAVVKFKTDEALHGSAFILPPKFVGHFIERAKAGNELVVGNDWIMSSFSDSQLYCLTLPEVKLSTYTGLFSDVEPYEPKALPLPNAVNWMLQRANVLLRGSAEITSDFVVKDGKLKIVTESKSGAGREFVTLAGKHENVEAKVVPDLILRVLPYVKNFIVTGGNRLCLFGEKTTYLISIA